MILGNKSFKLVKPEVERLNNKLNLIIHLTVVLRKLVFPKFNVCDVFKCSNLFKVFSSFGAGKSSYRLSTLIHIYIFLTTRHKGLERVYFWYLSSLRKAKLGKTLRGIGTTNKCIQSFYFSLFTRCQLMGRPDPPEPVASTELPQGPWCAVAID